MLQQLSWDVQILLDQFSGSPGVGLTEYYLAVSGTFSLVHIIMMWSVLGWIIHRSVIGGSDQPPFGVPSPVDSPWRGGKAYSIKRWKLRNPQNPYSL